MNNNGLALAEEKEKEGKVIPFKKQPKMKKDGSGYKNVKSNSIKGNPHEVYPLKSREDIEAMKNYFRNKMSVASNDEDKFIAGRYLMMFCLAINIGLRFSDILTLKWGEIFDGNKRFRDGIRRSEKKTGKFKTFFLNQSCRTAITEYINRFRVDTDPNHYIFESREGKGALLVPTAYTALKDAAKAVGIKQNFGTHSCRKTFGYFWYTMHNQDMDALVHLQRLFAHSSPAVTLRYIGIEDKQSKQFYDDINL
jgi:integrase